MKRETSASDPSRRIAPNHARSMYLGYRYIAVTVLAVFAGHQRPIILNIMCTNPSDLCCLFGHYRRVQERVLRYKGDTTSVSAYSPKLLCQTVRLLCLLVSGSQEIIIGTSPVSSLGTRLPKSGLMHPLVKII